MEQLTFDTFQLACVPRKRPLDSQPITFWACGLGEEAGEVLGVVKKAEHRGWSQELNDRLIEECGDLLFYMRQVLELQGWTLEDAAQCCLNKIDLHQAGDK